MSEGLVIWTIYDHPLDRPDMYVARKWIYDHPTSEVYLDRDVERLRALMRKLGLVRITRSVDDDPKIMETWL